MVRQNKPLCLAVVNVDELIIDLIKDYFKAEGFEVVGKNKEKLEQFLIDRQPDFVVWGIYEPFVEHWQEYQKAKSADSSKIRCFIGITDNKKGLDKEIGPNNVIEFHGELAALDEIKREITEEIGICKEREV